MGRFPIPRRIEEALYKFFDSADAFGTPVQESTREIIDAPGTIPSNRERFRYYEDSGSGYNRINNPIENNTNNFQDNSNHFLIQCPAGEKREFRTAELAQYQSGYETEWGMSWQAAESLSDGQKIRIQLTDEDRENKVVVEYRNNSGTIEAEVYLETAAGKKNTTGSQVFNTKKPLTSPRITSGYSNFYGVGEHRIKEGYIEDIGSRHNVDQKVDLKAVIGDVDDWSVESFNFHLGVEVDCTGSASSLDVEAGTMSYKIRGDTPEIRRQKEFRQTELTYDGTNNNFEPVLATRVRPEYSNITTEIPGTELTQPAGTPGEMVAVAVFPDEVTVNQSGGSWSTPREISSDSSVVQVTDDVTQIVDRTGSLAADIPEVHEKMRQVSVSATEARKSTGGASTETIRAPINPDEIVVYLVQTDDGSSADFNIRTITEENW